MGYKLVLLSTLAVLIQSISSQCIGNLNSGLRGLGNGYPYAQNVAGPFGNNLKGSIGQPGCSGSTGGSFAVTSTSPVSPIGVSVLAENLAIEGPLTVGGNLPFLGTVGIEGTMTNVGVGTVSYGCGNGIVGIDSENTGVAGLYSIPGSSIASSGSYSFGSPVGALGSYAGTAGANSIGSYGLVGSNLTPNAGISGSYGLVGSNLTPNAGISGSYGLVGSNLSPNAGISGSYGLFGSNLSPNAGISGSFGSSNLSFGSGLGLNGFKNVR